MTLPSHGAIDWLYEAARQHVENWEPGRLEERSAAAYSSQALCISVFGALDGHPRGPEILRAIGEAAGVVLPADAAEIVCEDRSHPEVLNELGGRSIPTSPDVLVRWPTCVLTIESKFREGLGPCGQTKQRTTKTRGSAASACTGDHASGSDRKTNTEAPCRLTVRDGQREPRRYWDVAERLFLPEVLAVPSRPCPFANGKYQLMRNVTFAAELAATNARPEFAFVVAYVAGSRSAAHTEQLVTQFKAMLQPAARMRCGLVAYEQIAEIAAANGDRRLAEWLEARINDGLVAVYPGGG